MKKNLRIMLRLIHPTHNCGQKVKALYENGWSIGSLDYFNGEVQKYRVSYPDGSEDYIGLEDIDGVEVVLL